MHAGGAAHPSGADAEPVVSDEPDLQSTAERTIVDLRGSGPFVSTGHYRYLSAQDALPLQLHSRLFVLAFAMRSRFDFVVNGAVFAIEPGEAILIPPGNTYSTGRDAQSRGQLIWLVLQSPSRPAADAGERMRLSEVIAALLRYGVCTCRAPQLTLDLLSRVLSDAGSDAGSGGEGAALWRESLCTAALVELWRGLSESDHALDPVHPGLRRAVAWAAENLEAPITVSELITVSGLSSTRFYELFAATFGTSPKDFVLRMKIERATELLRANTISVTEVAHLLGFSSSQHFGTAFRRYVGTSPSAYRALRPAGGD